MSDSTSEEPAAILLQLVDAPEQSGRTTASLLSSLAHRLAVLHGVSGATAVGSIVSGFASLGREVSTTAAGARLRRALEAGRAGTNGEFIWRELGLEKWASAHPPVAVLDQLRNDAALLQVTDLEEQLDLGGMPPERGGRQPEDGNADAEFLDFVVGLWFWACELQELVEDLAAPTLGDVPEFEEAAEEEWDPPTSILR